MHNSGVHWEIWRSTIQVRTGWSRKWPSVSPASTTASGPRASAATTSPLSSILEADPNPDFHSQHWSHLTDVSGHGLIGAVATAARLYGLDVELELSPMVAISADVLTTPVECLQNPISSYDLDFDGHPVEALTLLTLRETAGPYLGFLEDAGQAKEIAADRGVMIGRYQRGAGGVKLSWQE